MAGHEGHRERMKKRFLRYGLDSFDDHNVLELLLFFAVPRRDTNALAHQLLDTFGSLDKVFEALPEELMNIQGIGENAAALIRLVPAASKRYLVAKESMDDILPDIDAIGRYLVPRFMSLRKECVMLLCLDQKMKVLDCRVIGVGSLSNASFSIREIVQICLLYNTKYAVLAHNHVGGIAIPSKEDIYATREVRKALELVDIRLLDHIIVAGQDFVSMKDDSFL